MRERIIARMTTGRIPNAAVCRPESQIGEQTPFGSIEVEAAVPPRQTECSENLDPMA